MKPIKLKLNVAKQLNVRKGMGVKHSVKTTVGNTDKVYTATQQGVVVVGGISSTWYYIQELGGWVNGRYSTTVSNPNAATPVKSGLDVQLSAEPNPYDITKADEEMRRRAAKEKREREGAIDEAVKELLENAMLEKTEIDASTRLFGQPFQFTKSTDPRVTTGKSPLGRKYLETIIAEAPIAFLIPGGANFLPDIKVTERKKALEGIQSAASSGFESWVMEDLLKTEMRYFDFIPDYFSYMKYVNLLCRVSAGFLGLEEYKYFDWSAYQYSNAVTGKEEAEVDGNTLKPVDKDKKKTDSKHDKESNIFDQESKDSKGMLRSIWEWGKDTVLNRKEIITQSLQSGSNHQYVQFYVDPSTSFQESSSSSTAQSIIADTLDKGSSFMKEVSFITNSAGGTGWAGNVVDGVISGAGNLAQLLGGMAGNGLFGRVMQSADAIIDGGNMIFPDIWGDSDYNKSYNISVNLVSPYGSKDSIYLHVLVPLFHLLVFALPRQLTANAYGHPFLLRVSSKGWFNSDMGIVDSIQFERVQGSYSVDGMPTEIRVNLSVRDLYNSLFTTPSTQPGKFFANSSLINWLAVISGLDITRAAFAEKWQLVTMIVTGKLADIPTNPFDKVAEFGFNFYYSITQFR